MMTGSRPPQDSFDDHTSKGGRTWTLVVSGVVLLLLVAGGAIVVAIYGGDGSPDTQPTTSSTAPSTTGSSAPEGDQTPPTSPPPVTWKLFGRVALPESASAGPRSIQGSVASGYARNPVGALIAATQIETRALLAPGDSWRAVVEQQIVPGPGRDAYTAARARITDVNTPDDRLGQVAGFRFVTYSPDTAVIQFVTRFPASGRMQVTTSTVRWLGDWKQELQPDGSSSPTVQPVTDLTGFVAWSGV